MCMPVRISTAPEAVCSGRLRPATAGLARSPWTTHHMSAGPRECRHGHVSCLAGSKSQSLKSHVTSQDAARQDNDAAILRCGDPVSPCLPWPCGRSLPVSCAGTENRDFMPVLPNHPHSRSREHAGGGARVQVRERAVGEHVLGSHVQV